MKKKDLSVLTGAEKFGTGLIEQATENPAQLASDLIVSAGIMKGLGKGAKSVKSAASEARITTESFIKTIKEPQAQPTGVPTWTKGEGWTNTKPTTSWAEFKTIKGLKSEVGIGAKAELATTIGSKHTFETMRASGKPLVVGTGAAAVLATRPAKGKSSSDPFGDRKKNKSVQMAPEISAARKDRNNENKLIVINGLGVLQFLNSEYHIEHLTWERSCAQIRKSFRKKTSRSMKNGSEYETTRWYRIMPDGSLKSTGSSDEPDYKEFYTPEPKVRYNFTVWIPESRLQRDEHIVIEEKDYKENLKMFEDCLVFKLSNCENYMHPLYANPDKVLSVWVPNAAGSSREDRKGSKCWNDGDCESCEHADECPVDAEEKDPEFPDDENEED